jgi:cytochrome c oxidase subunit I+III
VHDTFFVVAHFHYVLIGGAVFPLFAALHYWFPKITGRMLDERIGKLSFVLAFVVFNGTFFPMHYLGLIGMPRRVYTYLPDLGWAPLNLLATVAAYVLAASVLLMLINAVLALRRPASAPDSPWDADTLEWSTSSPPPNYNFLELPVVRGRWALWDERGQREVVRGIRSDRREVLVTEVLDGEPQTKSVLPGPTPWPFIAACAVSLTFGGAIFTPWAVPIGALLSFFGFVGWLWPREEERKPAWSENAS